jgi:hypothetical protein
MSNVMKISPVVNELLYAEGRTDGQTDKYDENLNHVTSLQAFLILRILDLHFFNKKQCFNMLAFYFF